MHRIVIPRMGRIDIPVNEISRRLQWDLMPSSPYNQKMLQIGIDNSPEGACLPFKLTLGNYIDSLQKGAQTIVTAGASGPCRFGMYPDLHKRILNNIGFYPDFIAVSQDKILDFINTIKHFNKKKSLIDIVSGAIAGYKKLIAIEKLQDHANFYGAIHPEISFLLNGYLKKIDETSSLTETFKIVREGCFKMQNFKRSENKNLRIGIIGEIFMVLEPFANRGIIEILNKRGVEVFSPVKLSEWIKFLLRIDFTGRFSGYKARKEAKPWLNMRVGGECLHNVGFVQLLKKAGFDGIIHLSPFGCMPEIIFRSILRKNRKSWEIPLLSLTFDDHTANVGIETRLEAFLDMIIWKKKRGDQ